jgi:hypothetical protein
MIAIEPVTSSSEGCLATNSTGAKRSPWRLTRYECRTAALQDSNSQRKCAAVPEGQAAAGGAAALVSYPTRRAAAVWRSRRSRIEPKLDTRQHLPGRYASTAAANYRAAHSRPQPSRVSAEKEHAAPRPFFRGWSGWGHRSSDRSRGDVPFNFPRPLLERSSRPGYAPSRTHRNH